MSIFLLPTLYVWDCWRSRYASSSRKPILWRRTSLCETFACDLSSNGMMIRAVATTFLATIFAFAAEPEWPSFRGPSSNPSAANSNLPEKWSTSENIEWTADIPGLGWSSPIVSGKSVFLTTVTTDGKAKQPQTGVDYSNDYVAELQKQGRKGEGS